MSVVDDKMYYGLKKMLSDNTNITAYSEHDTIRQREYVYVTLDDVETVLPSAGSSTYRGVFNIDYITNSKDVRKVRNDKSKLLEALAENTEFNTATTHYYFNGEVQTTEPGDEDEDYEFRIVYEISHTKVS